MEMIEHGCLRKRLSIAQASMLMLIFHKTVSYNPGPDKTN